MLFEKIKLEADENIIVITRRHWFVVLLEALPLFFSSLLPVAIYIASFFTIGEMNIPNLYAEYPSIAIYLTALWLLLHWMGLINVWTHYYLDLWAITDRRIIAIDQKRLFSRSVGSFRLERLQDMNIEIPGFLATMFNYGDIEAQTASGSEEEFQARGLPDPRELKSIILQASDKRMVTLNDDL